MTMSNKRFSTPWYLPVIGCLGIGLSQSVFANITTVTVTGTVALGQASTDYNGIFVNLIPNQLPYGNLSGLPFTATFNLDDTKGAQHFLYDLNGTLDFSSIAATGAQNSPISAMLTINGKSVSYACVTIPPYSNAVASVSLSPQQSQSTVAYSTGSCEAEAGFVSLLLETDSGPLITNNANWQAPYAYRIAANTSITSSFVYSLPNTAPIAASASLVPTVVTVTGAVTMPSPPRIIFNGQDVTGTTVTVAAGQPISLSTNHASQTGQIQAWHVCESLSSAGIPCAQAITTFTPTPENYQTGAVVPLCIGSLGQSLLTCTPVNSVVPADNLQSTVNFYWVTPGIQLVTYTYRLQSGYTASASATFNVVGPTNVKVSAPPPGLNQGPQLSMLQIVDKPDGPYLSFGDKNGAPVAAGMLAYASATLPNTSGSFHWVQLLDGDVIELVSADQTTTYSCSSLNGKEPNLDNDYFYSDSDTITDSPAQNLTSNYSEASRSFNAHTYLMWQSSAANSIPVPLGFFTWGFSGAALYSPTSSGCASPIDGFGFCLASFPSSISSPVWYPLSAFPTWSNVAINHNLNCTPSQP